MQSTGAVATLRSVSNEPIPLRQATRDRLEQITGEVLYGDLTAHLQRDAVFVVASGVELLDCAVAIAMDDVDAVEPWLADGSLRKPSQQERVAWPEATGKKWRAVVVQPFVLVQDL